MLFALAIAQVATQASTVINSDAPDLQKLPAYSHLFLAAVVITASWVGWGWSSHGSSNVENIFTLDFVELLIDLWLVAVYFFIVMGAELPVVNPGVTALTATGVIETTGTATSITPSIHQEGFWIAVVFVTYFLWDVLTKCQEPAILITRGWASLVCATTACFLTWLLVTLPVPPTEQELRSRVILGDMSLLFLVLLFRAMKLGGLLELRRAWWLIVAMMALVWLCYFAAAYDTVNSMIANASLW